MIEYKLVVSFDFEITSGGGIDVIQTKVNALIAEGWQPLGGISVCSVASSTQSCGYTSQHCVLMQAMIRDKLPAKENET